MASLSILVGLIAPAGSTAATLSQVQGQLSSWHLNPPPLFPQGLPSGFESAGVFLTRFSGIDYDVEIGSDGVSQYGCERVNDGDCVELRRGDSSLFGSILSDPTNCSEPQQLQVGARTVWFVCEGRDAGGWEMVWQEQGRTYIAWQWTADQNTALSTLDPFVQSLQTLASPPTAPPPKNPCGIVHGSIGKELFAALKCTALQTKLEVECGVDIVFIKAFKALKAAKGARGLYDLRKVKHDLKPLARLVNHLRRASFRKVAPAGFRTGDQVINKVKHAKKAWDVVQLLVELHKALSKPDYRKIAADIAALADLKACVQGLELAVST